jgi:hypothetical protein
MHWLGIVLAWAGLAQDLHLQRSCLILGMVLAFIITQRIMEVKHYLFSIEKKISVDTLNQ